MLDLGFPFPVMPLNAFRAKASVSAYLLHFIVHAINVIYIWKAGYYELFTSAHSKGKGKEAANSICDLAFPALL